MAELRIGQGLSLPLDVLTRTTAIVGQRGTGKTSTAVVLVEEADAAGGQFAVIDPTGAWYGLRSNASGKGAGLKVVVFGGHHGDLPLQHTAGAFLARLVVEQSVNVVLDLELLTKGQQIQFVAEFAEALYHGNREAVTIVIDEAHRFAPQQLREPGGYGARCLGAVTDVVTLGRRKGLGAVLISQRPAKINKDVFEQSEVMIVHRLMGPNDRKAIAGWLEDVGDAIHGEIVMREVPRLAPQHALVYAPHYSVAMMTAIRAKRTFDSSATPEVGASVIEPKGRADVDLAAIELAMADAIETAKANDPKALREEVARLREQITRAELELDSRPLDVAPVEIPVIPPEVTAAVEGIQSVLRSLKLAADALAENLLLIELADVGPVLTAEPRVSGNTAAGLAIAERAESRREQPHPREENRKPPSKPLEVVGLRKLVKGQQRMLEAVAEMHPVPQTRRQIGLGSKLSYKGGTFLKYLGILKRDAYLTEHDDGRYTVGAMGWVVLGGEPKRPVSSIEVRELWLGRLTGGARRMLEELLRTRELEEERAGMNPGVLPTPGGVGWLQRVALGERAGVTAGGGTFGKYLGILRSAGLIEEENGDGGPWVRASDILFTAAKGVAA